ncbi:hypothetical protein ACJRO7_026578 [Eucalyptus globulus]|uniref:Uncharacterized protein n=1 Tax=Eucalyptus globulus TaxID=34317 RepID=A0ABD3JPV9_EUCGL
MRPLLGRPNRTYLRSPSGLPLETATATAVEDGGGAADDPRGHREEDNGRVDTAGEGGERRCDRGLREEVLLGAAGRRDERHQRGRIVTVSAAAND